VFASGAQPEKVITFVYEAKSNSSAHAQRQLALYLCSAQNQRRALGLNGPLFGATLVGSTLTIYGSKWDEDDFVVISPTNYKFSLATFPSFIICYILLCKIANHMAQEFNDAIEQWRDPQNNQILLDSHQKARDKEWRPAHFTSSSNGAQDDIESQVMEDWESFENDSKDEDEPMVIDRKGDGHNVDLLTMTNLQALGSGTISIAAKNIQDRTQGLVKDYSMV